MQVPLAMVGGVASLLAWILMGKIGFLVGAVLLLAVVPYTLLVVQPTNRRLHTLHSAGQSGDAGRLLRRWNVLHAVRTALSLVALSCMLLASRS